MKVHIRILIALVLTVVLAVPAYAAFPRPNAVTAISNPTTCQWGTAFEVTFDTQEVVCVGIGFNGRPSLGTVDSFWRAYWTLLPPFYHSGGFTQNGTPDPIYFQEK